MWSGPTPGYSTPTWALRRMTMTSRSAEPVTTGAPALEIRDVVAGYGGGDVLHGVTMEVYEGGITCVVGPNGAGKSTLLASISGLLNPRLGHVSLRGERLSGKSPRQVLDMGVVLVPQNHSLFRDMTVRENIVLGGYILRQRGLADRRLDTVLETILLVEQNARAGLRLSTHGVVLENGRVRLAGSGHEVLHHPEIGALYLGGAVIDSSGKATPAAEAADAAAAA